MICRLSELESFLRKQSEEVADLDPSIKPPVYVTGEFYWKMNGTGKYGWHRTNAESHLARHHISFPKSKGQKLSDFEQAQTDAAVSSFDHKCRLMRGKHGWTFGQVKCVYQAMLTSESSSHSKAGLDAMCDYICGTNQPFRVVESQVFRDTHKGWPIRNRRQIRKDIMKRSLLMSRELLDEFKNKIVTLTVDIGTVWSRYLAIYIQAKGSYPFLLRLVEDEAIRPDVIRGWLPLHTEVHAIEDADNDGDGDGGHNDDDDDDDDDVAEGLADKEEAVAKMKVCLTGELCASMLDLLVTQLHSRDIYVAAIATDNGANMVKAVRLTKGPMGSPIAIRCACHTIQLIARAILNTPDPSFRFETTWKHIIAFKDAVDKKYSIKFPKLQETRWNSEYETVSYAYDTLQQEAFALKYLEVIRDKFPGEGGSISDVLKL